MSHYSPPPQQYYPPQYYPPQQPQYPPQQQQYPPQQYYPPPNAGAEYNQPPTYEHNQGQVHSDVAEKWNPRPRFQDLWAAILFLIHFAAFVLLSYIGIKAMKEQPPPNTSGDNNNNLNTDIIAITGSIAMLVVVGIFGFICSFLYMILMQKFPKPLIKITLYLSIALYFVIAAVYFYLKQFIPAILFAIFGVVYLICAFTWRDRIPFAAVMLETVTTITKKYYGTLIMGFVGLIFQVGWSIWFIVTLIGATNKFYQSSGCGQTAPGSGGRSQFSCKSPILYLVLLFLVFSFYWTSQVIKNIVHVTDAGVFATFYFLEGTPRGTGSTPTLSSLKRACTTSFGSVCYGSLIIAILNTMKAVLRIFANSDEGACGFLACCLLCLLDWIESLVEYFNHYAYVQVAMFGKSYCESAQDTWKLIKDRGVEAIINDNLIGNVLTMGAVFIGALCAIFGFGYIHLFNKNITDGNTIFILILISFFLGLMMTIVVTNAIESGVVTTFVALAEDPDALRRTKPELFERIRREWPRVVQGM